MTDLHPWLSTSEALRAIHHAVKIPVALSGGKVTTSELMPQAMAILTECAQPAPEHAEYWCLYCHASLEDSRRKFCSAQCRSAYAQHVLSDDDLPPHRSHVGSMHSWPEGQRFRYAVREVSYALCIWLRTRRGDVKEEAA